MIVPDVRYMDYDTYVFPGAKFNSSQWDINREERFYTLQMNPLQKDRTTLLTIIFTKILNIILLHTCMYENA